MVPVRNASFRVVGSKLGSNFRCYRPHSRPDKAKSRRVSVNLVLWTVARRSAQARPRRRRWTSMGSGRAGAVQAALP